MLNIRQGYSFDDVLLVPKYSNIKSRADVDLSIDLGKGIKLDIPIISANMKHVSGPLMVSTIAKLGGLGILHRFQSCNMDKLAAFLMAKDSVPKELINRIGVSVGISDDDKSLCDQFVDLGARVICVDVAHADSGSCVKFIRWFSNEFPHVLLIAGNIATPLGFLHLGQAGADVVKCGLGSGSICSTRIETGNGVPQLTAISDIERGRFSYPELDHVKIIADGGIRRSGDCVKSLCFSNVIMLGSLLAGTDEAPGEIIIHKGKKYKQYAGSSTFKNKNVEGVVGLVPNKGSVVNVIEKLLEGIRSGCSYQGAQNLKQLRENPQFVQITNAGLVESHPHNIILK